MTPGQQLQRLLGDVLQYDPDDVVSLLPLAAALLSALCTRILVLQHQATEPAAGPPETDYLLNTDEAARRLAISTKWLRENIDTLPFAFHMGKLHRFSARGLEEWIAEQREAK